MNCFDYIRFLVRGGLDGRITALEGDIESLRKIIAVKANNRKNRKETENAE